MANRKYNDVQVFALRLKSLLSRMSADSFHEYRTLSVRGLLSIALATFETYCKRFVLEHCEISTYLDWMWEFFPESVQFEGSAWPEREPELVATAKGGEFPDNFETFLKRRKCKPEMIREFISSVTEILASNFGTPNHKRSFLFFAVTMNIASKFEISHPHSSLIHDSSWDMHGGWGRILADEELTELREKLIIATNK